MSETTAPGTAHAGPNETGTAPASMLLATDFFFYRYFESLGRHGTEQGRRGLRGSDAATAT